MYLHEVNYHLKHCYSLLSVTLPPQEVPNMPEGHQSTENISYKQKCIILKGNCNTYKGIQNYIPTNIQMDKQIGIQTEKLTKFSLQLRKRKAPA